MKRWKIALLAAKRTIMYNSRTDPISLSSSEPKGTKASMLKKTCSSEPWKTIDVYVLYTWNRDMTSAGEKHISRKESYPVRRHIKYMVPHVMTTAEVRNGIPSHQCPNRVGNPASVTMLDRISRVALAAGSAIPARQQRFHPPRERERESES